MGELILGAWVNFVGASLIAFSANGSIFLGGGGGWVNDGGLAQKKIHQISRSSVQYVTDVTGVLDSS